MSDPFRESIVRLCRAPESRCLATLLPEARLTPAETRTVRDLGIRLTDRARAHLREASGFEALLKEYDLGTEEGILLMCLAEALLRIPDPATADRLIHDLLDRGAWERHLGNSQSLLVNASTWGLLLTGRVLDLGTPSHADVLSHLRRLAGRVGDRALRLGLRTGMNLLARQFVLGEALTDALARTAAEPHQRYSYDCLGEGARTASDAQRHLETYHDAIRSLAHHGITGDVDATPGISVKLSALHPRYEYAQRTRVLTELTPLLTELAEAARDARIGLTLDAEEVQRLELSLDLFERVMSHHTLANWDGFGLAVQSYQKRARAVIAWLDNLATCHRRRIPVRLVKGAYWDTEIKRAQTHGFDDYPVFTRKAATDVAYLACARAIAAADGRLFGQFATHNAYTVAYVFITYGDRRDYEFQRLHGMGEALYDALNAETSTRVVCRTYAPVGAYEDLLPYLVRRLLENGSNSSFVNQLGDPDLTTEDLVTDPLTRAESRGNTPHPQIPLPGELFGTARPNSVGLDLSDPEVLASLQAALRRSASREWEATPRLRGAGAPAARPIAEPAHNSRRVGWVTETDTESASLALDAASRFSPDWIATSAEERANRLRRAADLMETWRTELVALCVREGGRCIPDALDEVRETVDFCRYYARMAETEFQNPQPMPGPAGEENHLALRGRGVFLCISPWNFPLSIFTGQIAAALAAGNTVLAKPARQTPLVAARAVALLHDGGIPPEALHLLPGSGRAIGNVLLADSRIAGVALTGSTDTAWSVQRALSERRGAISPLIAETGGQNAMIVDSSALPEQVVDDVIVSAFNSAGQRCSALRVLFIQEEVADRILSLLAGAMDELTLGDPMDLSTDIGPVIDTGARDVLRAHAHRMDRAAHLVRALKVPAGLQDGTYFAPRVYEIDAIDLLTEEIFGPVLHVIRYPANRLDAVIDAINSTGYGLTLGVHSRVESTWKRVRQRARAGNLYVNRNMIGAVVGVQPFGGTGLSGTGPKAGGPRYLHRFACEHTVSVNTAAAGGNPRLLSL